MIFDITPVKQGRFSLGVQSPTVAETSFAVDSPDYAFLAAWNHSEDIRGAQRWFEEDAADASAWLTQRGLLDATTGICALPPAL